MRETIRFGRIAGIPVGAHWSALVVLLLVAQGMAVVVLPALAPGHPPAVYWATGLVTAVVFLASLLAHELAHALVAQRFGLPVQRITLWMLGGVSMLGGEPPTPRADLLVAVSGPLASFSLGLVSGAVAVSAQALGAPGLVVVAAGWLAVMNLVLAVFNLLPGAPLDGGRVLRAVLWRRYGDVLRAEVDAARAGRLLGYLLALAGALELLGGQAGGLWLILLASFLVMAANAEGRTALLRNALAGLTVREAMTPDPAVGHDWLPVDQFTEQVAAHTRQVVFPVVDVDGRPTGVVTLSELGKVPPELRGGTRLSEFQVPLARLSVVAPGDQMGEVLARTPLTGDGLVLVVEDERLVGVLSADDATRALYLASARGSRGAGPVQR